MTESEVFKILGEEARREVEAFAQFAIIAHEKTNHTYDGQPYSVHLKRVYQFALKYIHLVPEKLWVAVLKAAYGHDLVEDARLTYNDVLKEAGEVATEIIYALTNEKGRTRKQRANRKYYRGIRWTVGATYCKLCDRLANIAHGWELGGGRMLKGYRKEHPHFKRMLGKRWWQFWRKNYNEMFVEMEEMLDLK